MLWAEAMLAVELPDQRELELFATDRQHMGLSGRQHADALARGQYRSRRHGMAAVIGLVGT